MTIAPSPRNPMRLWQMLAMIGIGVMLGVVVIWTWHSLSLHLRQSEVANRGTSVMPFDLDQTMHHFIPQEDGGLQMVVVRDAANTEQIALIREHLQEEQARFAAGNFASPEAIHGAAMPGLAELAAGAAAIAIEYSELPDGAQLVYRTSDPALVDALHQWFAAQVSDHGNHATDAHRH